MFFLLMSWVSIGNRCKIFVNDKEVKEEINYIIKGSLSKYKDDLGEVDIKEDLTEEDIIMVDARSKERVAHIPSSQMMEDEKKDEKHKKKSLFLQRIQN